MGQDANSLPNPGSERLEYRLHFHNRRDRIRRDNLIRAVILVYGAGLLVIDDDILMIAHLVIGIDHETLRRRESLWHVAVQKLPHLFFGFTAVLAYVLEIIAQLLCGLENQSCNRALIGHGSLALSLEPLKADPGDRAAH